MSAYPPYTFANQGNFLVVPPAGVTTPAAQLDANFAATAPAINDVNYPDGSTAAIELAGVAIRNGAFPTSAANALNITLDSPLTGAVSRPTQTALREKWLSLAAYDTTQHAITAGLASATPIYIPAGVITSATGVTVDMASFADQAFMWSGAGASNGAAVGAALKYTGTTGQAVLITSPSSNQNASVLFEDFSLVGDGTQSAGADGFAGSTRGLVTFKRMNVSSHRGSGYNFSLCYSGKIEDGLTLNNFKNGIALTNAANRFCIRDHSVFGSGRDFSAQYGNIVINGIANTCYAPRIDNTDWSTSGRLVSSVDAGTLTSIVVSGSTATAHSTAHGLTTGNIISVYEPGGVDLNSIVKAFQSTITVVDANTYTWPTFAPAGTYNATGLRIMTYAYGMVLLGCLGFSVTNGYCEQPAGWGLYTTSGAAGVMHGGFYLDCWVGLDAADHISVDGVHFQGAGGLFTNPSTNRCTLDIGYANTFSLGATWSKSSHFRAGGQQFSTSLPGTGTWEWVGENALNASLSAGGVSGWRRLTTGTGAALNTDWAEIRDTYLYGSKTFDPPSVPAVSAAAGTNVTTTTVTVSGVALGDFAFASFSLDLAGLVLSCYVSAANTVTVTLVNPTVTAIDLASGTLRVRAQHF